MHAEQACSRELIFTVVYGISNNTISYKLLTFRAQFIVHKNAYFDHYFFICVINRSDLAQPGTANTLVKGLFVKQTKRNYTEFGFGIVVPNFEQVLSIRVALTAFLGMTVFCHCFIDFHV